MRSDRSRVHRRRVVLSHGFAWLRIALVTVLGIENRSERNVAMSEVSVEQRLQQLETQMNAVLLRLGKQPRTKNWRQTIGRFSDQPEMRAVFDDAERLREEDRQCFFAEFDRQEQP